MSVLADLLPDVDESSPVVLIMWLAGDGQIAFVWEGTDPSGILAMLDGASRNVRREHFPRVSEIEPHGTLQ